MLEGGNSAVFTAGVSHQRRRNTTRGELMNNIQAIPAFLQRRMFLPGRESKYSEFYYPFIIFRVETIKQIIIFILFLQNNQHGVNLLTKSLLHSYLYYYIVYIYCTMYNLSLYMVFTSLSSSQHLRLTSFPSSPLQSGLVCDLFLCYFTLRVRLPVIVF